MLVQAVRIAEPMRAPPKTPNMEVPDVGRCAVIQPHSMMDTRGNGPDMEGLHTREPVMLHREEWRPWLDCEPMSELLTPTAAGLFRRAIETRVYA